MRSSVNSNILSILSLFLLFSCGESKRSSADFSPEGAFTPGIEGPAVNPEGQLFAVNFREEGTIGRVNKEGEGEIFLRLPEGSIGNGIRFDLKGDMFIADYAQHRIYRVAAGTRTPVIWAQDSTMNQPNDLAIAPDGRLYLSDPNWSEGSGQLWTASPAGELSLLEKNMGTTNGIEVSPDGRYLYVNESVQRKVWRYEITENGKLMNKELFIEFDDFGLDGMRCDSEGNLFIARYDKGSVVVISPRGKLLEEITLKGKKPSNLTFGGRDGKTCFVTMADRGCFEQFRVEYPGNYYSKINP